MRKHLLFSVVALLLSTNAFATIWVITNSVNVYVPAALQVNLGDTILYGASITHTGREVSQNTWNLNDTTTLGGGLGDFYSGDTLYATNLGIIYYVCVEHVMGASQMKGTIQVSQVGFETNSGVTMKIMQSLAEQYVKLIISGGNSGEMHVDMLNLSGHVVKSMDLQLMPDETSAIIQVSDMPKGIYMIRWSYGSTNRAKKIILQ